MKNAIKRFLSLALALFMVISLLPVSAAFAEVSEGSQTVVNPEGGEAQLPANSEEGAEAQNSETLQGSGSAEDPILINDLEDLILFRDNVNAGTTYKGQYVKLTAPIDLNNEEWTPIGNSTNKFLGIFDGGNNTISNLKINTTSSYIGLFGYTSEGELKNLTIHNVDIDGRLGVGALVGCPFTSDITNIKLTGKVTIDAAFYVGGVAGRNAYGALSDITVDVTSDSYVKATSLENGTAYRTYVGGVVGFLGEGNTTLTNVTSNIKVIGDVCDIGGIAGIAHYGNTFSNVTFTGSVEAPEGAEEVGGIAGVWHNQAGQTVTFNNVTSTGSVTVGDEDVSAECGVVGGAYNASNSTPGTTGSLVVDGKEVWPVVAMIGSTPYSSLQAAIDAVENGETIVLQCDLTPDEALNIPASAVVDMDLNGKTLSGSILAPNAELSIKNGSIINTNSAVSALEINAGELTLTNVSIDSARHAVRIDGAVTATIDGGTYRGAIGTGTGTYHAVNVSGAADVTILAGTFVGPKGTTADSGSAVNVQTGAAVSIIGGNFSGGKNATVSAQGTLAISGGTFDQPINEAYCAESYVPTELSAGVYSVKAAQEAWILRNGAIKYYATLAEAVADAKAGETVMLCANAIVTEPITVDKNLTIADYGQLAITFMGNGAIHVTGDNALTLDKVVISEAKIYADAVEAGATVNGAAITGIASQASVLISDGTNVTVTNPQWVAKNGTTYYMTIAEAINAATAGDTVNIFAGEYTGDVSIKKAFTVVGETDADGNNLVKIDGNVSASSGATIKNLSVHNEKTGTYACALDVNGNNIVIDGCELTGYNAMRYCYANGDITIRNSKINGSNFAIHFDGSTGGKIVIDNCEVTGWIAFAGSLEKLTLKESIFYRGGYAGGRTYNDIVEISGCTFKTPYKFDIATTDAVVTVTDTAFENGSELKTLFNADDVENNTITVDGVKLFNPKVYIGETAYPTFEAALDAVQDGETITIANVSGSENKEIEFTKDISFTITGKAPNYALPTVTFQNATVTIKDAEILIPELDARQNATINVVDSIVHDAGGNSIVKSYYNGAINISGNSKVYTMQVTTMGYITVSDTAKLNATWQTNIYGNGMITVKDDATFATAALHLTGQDYSDRDNTDADRAGKPAALIVDGAELIVGKVYSDNGADYSYNSSKGINIGTVSDKSAVLDIKNGAKVNIYMANGETANIGAGGTVNVDASSLIVTCRAENGAVTLANNGTIRVSGESDIAASKVTGAGWVYMNGVTLDADTKLIGAKVRFASGTNNIDGSVIDDGFFQVGIGAYNGVDANVDTANGVVVNVKNATIGSKGSTYAGWIGTGYYDTDAEKTAAMTNAKYVLNIENSVAEFGYLHISNDGELNVKGNAVEKAWYNNSDYSFYAGDFIINGTAAIDATDVLALYTKVSCDNGTNKPGTLNIASGTEYEAERHNGAIAGTNFVLYKTGVVNVEEGAKLNIGEYTSIAADAVMNIGGTVTALGTITNNGTINLTAVNATLTTPEAPVVLSALRNYDSAYADGAYLLIAKNYVAQVGEEKYEVLAEAIEAAQAGDTIKLLADGDLILADKAMTIVKNGYTVVVAALNGYMVVETDEAYIVKSTSDLSGDEGEAKAYIDADGDGHVDEKLMTLQEALDAAQAGQTVRLVEDLIIDGSITIPSDITLDLEGHTLTVNSLVGLSGSKLAGNPYDVDGTYGKLAVKSENFVLYEASYIDAAGYNVIPVYNKDHYVFSRMQVNTDQKKEPNRGLVINEEDKTIYFQFVTNMTGDVRKNLLNDGAEDNELTVIIRLEWQTESGTAHQDFVYKKEFVEKVCAGGYDFSFTLVGYDALSIDIETLTVKGMVITESGAVVSGTEWTK